jgi:hypothetical protein
MAAYRRYDEPPEHLTWYHVPFMLRAEAGCLKHNRRQYPIHGIPNNAVACIWMGLLADSPDGVVLTDLGRTMLAAWKASPEGQTARERQRADGQDDEQAASSSAVPRRKATAQIAQDDEGALFDLAVSE